MQGQKGFEPKLFYHVQLEELVPSDHELRRVLEIVNFDVVRSKVRDKYSHTGQPSVDPVVITKMLFLGYYYGIHSERKLAKEIIVNNAYRWFLGYDLDEAPPTHSVLSKARSRYGVEVFKGLFDHIVEQCVAAGLVSGEKAFLDYTLIEANAASDSLVPRVQLMTPSQYADHIMKDEESSSDDSSGNLPSDPGSQSQEPKKIDQKYNDQMVSQTDPDATYIEFGKKAGLNYEGHYLVDGQNHIIVNAMTTNTLDNAGNYASELLQHFLFRHGLKFESLCADAEYGTQEVYAFLDHQAMTPYIPAAQPGPQHQGKYFQKPDFKYDAQNDIYICPAGKRLTRSYVDHRKQSIQYRCKSSICQACPLRSQCTTSKHGRKIRRLLYEEIVNRAKAIMTTPEYRRQMKHRRISVEPLFSEAKDCHGMRRAKYRGIERVGIQVLWTATVQNIKRLIKGLIRPPVLSNACLVAQITQYFSDLLRPLISRLNCQRSLGNANFVTAL